MDSTVHFNLNITHIMDRRQNFKLLLLFYTFQVQKSKPSKRLKFRAGHCLNANSANTFSWVSTTSRTTSSWCTSNLTRLPTNKTPMFSSLMITKSSQQNKQISIANFGQIKFEIPSYLLIHPFYCQFNWLGGIESSYPKLTLFNVPNGNLATHGHNSLLTFFIALFNVPNGNLATHGHNSLLTFFIALFNVKAMHSVKRYVSSAKNP